MDSISFLNECGNVANWVWNIFDFFIWHYYPSAIVPCPAKKNSYFVEVLMLITKSVQPASVTKTCMIARRKKRSNLELIVSSKKHFG